jgi:predicted MPP superfamily phosphohydrolase
LSDAWLRGDLANYPKAQKYTRIALLIWMLIILLPLISQFANLGNILEIGPWIWISITYLWIGGIMFWILGLAAVGIPVFSIPKLYKYYIRLAKEKKQILTEQVSGQVIEQDAEAVPKELMSPTLDTELVRSSGINRRQLLRLGLVAAPPLIVATTSIGTVFAKNNLNVRYIDLPVANLPQDLEGYTITHLSDTHVGMVTGRDRIEHIVQIANQLKSNMIVLTGDILDNDFNYMSDVVDTIGQLKAEHGVHLCIGNHDKIHNADDWIKAIRDARLNLLLDESFIIDTGGTPIKLLGIDYVSKESQDASNIYKADEHIKTPDKSLKILLAHHPHAFDPAAKAGIPITLAGHTHGGQIAIRLGENFELFNAGDYLFRYVDGIYRKEQGNSLYVHRGSGDWFPLRAGVPTEVVQLRLIGA